MFHDLIVLASASPRRRELLASLGVPLRLCPMDIDESVADHEHVSERVRTLARLKAQAAGRSLQADDGARWILGADTLVALDERVYGKPADRDDARRMLSELAGRTHMVHSGLALLDRLNDSAHTVLSSTSVSFAPLSPLERDRYLDSGEWQGAAGAYRIQEGAALFIERVEGSFSGVVGLPLREFYVILAQAGYPLYAEAAGEHRKP